MNGDVLTKLNYDQLNNFHNEQTADVTIVLETIQQKFLMV